MRLRLALLALLAVASAMEFAPSRRAIPTAPQSAAASGPKKDEIEGSGDPPRAGTEDTDGRKAVGYSPDDEDSAVEGSGAPPPPPAVAPKPAPGSGPLAPAATPAQPAQPPKRPQAPAPPPPDSDDESIEGSGNDRDGGTPFTPPSITTTTTTTSTPPVVVPGSGSGSISNPAAPPKTMWETVAVTETPVLTTRATPAYEKPVQTTPSSSRERSTERTPSSRPNTTEQPALFPFHAMLKPGIFAAVVGGTVVGLLVAILLVMFIVYRMRKRDEGSYALEEPKQRPYAGYAYTKASSTKEFYA